MGVTLTHHSHMALLGPHLTLVGFRASSGLVCGPLSAYVVHFGVSSWPFFYWHRAIGSKWGPPRFWLIRSLLEYVKFGALEIVLIVSPLSELRIMCHLFCCILYFPRSFLLKIHNFFQQFVSVFTLIRESRFNSFC